MIVKMKKSIVFLAVIFLAGLAGPAGFAQRNTRINGNGVIESRTRAVGAFTRIRADMPLDLRVDCGLMQSVEVTADANLFGSIKTYTVDQVLVIERTGWLEPSQKIQVSVDVPFITALQSSGHGEYFIQGLDGFAFTYEGEVADVVLVGQVKELTVINRSGVVNAAKLAARDARVDITGKGDVYVNVSGTLTGNLEGKGRVIYSGKPQQIRQNATGSGEVVSAAAAAANQQAQAALQYVTFRLYNNSLSKANLRIEGPAAKRFGYGTSLVPLQRKEENFPVGTEVYLVADGEKKKLLYTLRTEDRDKTVKLF